MNIRRAKLDDLASIVEIYNHEVVHSTATFDTEPFTVDGRRQWFEEHGSERHPIFVAEVGTEIFGWSALSPWSERRAYERAAEISVYVAPAQRRRGVGKALLRSLINHARRHGLAVLLARISCGEGPGSRKLHESLGFMLIGTMHGVGKKFGRVLDVDLLEYPLERESIESTRLILIRHASPTKRSDRPASEWPLSEAGKESCRKLASRLSRYGLKSIVSSVEPKAAETAKLVADELDIASRTASNLHEHKRTNVPFYDSPEEFNEQVKRLFDSPDKLVFGEESATDARRRFQEAVEQVVESWDNSGPVAIVAHGTVISLLVGDWCGRKPREVWCRLGLPSFVVLSLQNRRLIELVEAVDSSPESKPLLRYYLERGGPDSNWNLSSESAGIEYNLKRWFEDGVDSKGRRVCNIGIGAGLWDDYLGYTVPRARITSIDIDAEICSIQRHRQEHEGHTNPASVLCLDLLNDEIPGDFDIVTIVGSTVNEMNDYERALARCLELTCADGQIFYADFHQFNEPGRFRDLAEQTGVEIQGFYEDEALGVFAFWARKHD